MAESSGRFVGGQVGGRQEVLRQAEQHGSKQATELEGACDRSKAETTR